MHLVFEVQVQRSPRAIAVISGNHRVGYGFEPRCRPIGEVLSQIHSKPDQRY